MFKTLVMATCFTTAALSAGATCRPPADGS